MHLISKITMSRRLESAFISEKGENWFSIPVFFVLMRETLEVMVVLSCMYTAVEKLGMTQERTWITYGTLLGLLVDIIIAAAIVSVFVSLRQNAFAGKSEIIFEGTLMLFTSIVITVFALGLSKFINGLDQKIGRKMIAYTSQIASQVAGRTEHDSEGTWNNAPGDEEEGDEEEDDDGFKKRETVKDGKDTDMNTVATAGAIAMVDVKLVSISTEHSLAAQPKVPKQKRPVFRGHRRRSSGADVNSNFSDNSNRPHSLIPTVIAQEASLAISAPVPPKLDPEELNRLRWGLFWMSFMAIVREGLECIVFLAGMTGSYTGESMIFPSIAGVLVGVALGYLFIRTSRAWAMTYFVLVSVFMLFAISAGLVTRAFTEFIELGMDGGPLIYNARACCNRNVPFWGFLRIIFGYNDKPHVAEFLSYVFYWMIALGLAYHRGILAVCGKAVVDYHIDSSDRALEGKLPPLTVREEAQSLLPGHDQPPADSL